MIFYLKLVLRTYLENWSRLNSNKFSSRTVVNKVLNYYIFGDIKVIFYKMGQYRNFFTTEMLPTMGKDFPILWEKAQHYWNKIKSETTEVESTSRPLYNNFNKHQTGHWKFVKKTFVNINFSLLLYKDLNVKFIVWNTVEYYLQKSS